MTGPRRILIDWEYLCDGICWVPDKEEHETPYLEGLRLRDVQRPGGPPVIREWRERLSEQVLRDLKAWNDSWDPQGAPDLEAARVLQERGRELAVRVQNELGTDGWEVLYRLGGKVHRVHPPGSWPAETWEQELLGYAPPDQREAAEEELRVIEGLRKDQQESGYTYPDQRGLAEEAARIREWLRKNQQQTGDDSSTPSEP